MQNDPPIAVVGFAYRAPGVGRKGLWEYLAEAKSAWSRVPADRFDQDAFYCPDSEKAGCFASKGGYFLPDDVYGFDAPFFNLRAEEARAVDPHHRMMLECALEAAESAGLSLADIAGANIGVFAALGASEYGQQMSEDLPSTTTWASTGTAPCMFANRLSYFFDLTGPSISLDAACASSSYAVHLACQSLRSGECNAAFVGAASLLLGPNMWILLDTMGALSPEGKCFSYDAKASGFGRGEGAACLLIKRLADAIKCGDPIHAVIRNSACSHSGRSEGITMPSRAAQEKLLLRAHEEIGLSPSETPVVEGHGTGTKVGDPIEAGAFATVLASERTPSNPLYIGSLKSNFGHLEGASGILGMIKAILMIQRGCVLPNAEFEEFNRNIEGKDKLRVAQTTMPWPHNAPKRVCVTNFGFGGSNAVIILEEAPTITGELANGTEHTDDAGLANGTAVAVGNGVVTHDHPSRDLVQQLFVLSAKSESSLTSYLHSFIEYLDKAAESRNFAKDLSFTLGQRRTLYPYRVAAIADSVASLKAQLSASKVRKMKDRAIAYAFTGQGAQHAQMAAGLRRYKPFATAIGQAEAHLHAMGASWSLIEELNRPDPESRINDAEISQPACTAIQLALVVLLKSWGVMPTTVTGHSSGEIAAAFAADMVSFQAAMAIAYFRGQAAAQLALEHNQKGAMLALGTSFEIASMLLQENANGYATIAAINSPQSVTVSGDESAIDNIQRIADARGLFVRRLKVKVAYHSHHMEQVAASYLASIKPFCNLESPSSGHNDSHAVFVSSVTGRMAGADTLDASYWVKNLLQPVRFADAIESVFSTHNDEINAGQRGAKLPNIIVEIGPHSALKNPIKQTLESLCRQSNQRQAQFTYLPSLVRGIGGDEALLGLAGNLISLGSSIQLAMVNQTDHHNAHVLTDLPPYAWDKSVRYVHKSRIAQERLHPSQPYDPLLGWKSPYSEGGEHTFRQLFTLDEIPWLRDHNVAGHIVFPMTGYLSMAIEAVRRVSPTCPSSILIQEFHAKRSLEIEEEERIDITTKLRPAATGTENFSSTARVFEILTWSEAHGWITHCHGRIEAEASEMTMESPTFKASAPLIGSEKLEERNVELEYAKLQQRQGGTLYGPAFKTAVRVWEGPRWTVLENELRELNLSLPCHYGSPVSVDPPTLDSFLQGMGPFQEIEGKLFAHMPNYVSQLRISNKIPANDKQRFTIVSRLIGHDTKAGSLHAGVAVFAQCSGSLMPVAEWESVILRSIGLQDTGDSTSSLPTSYYWDLVPSLDFAGNEDLARTFAVEPFDETNLLDQSQLNRAAVYYISRALKETAGDDFSQLPSYLLRFLNWARRVVTREKLAFDGGPSSRLAEVSNSSAQGEMLCAIGEQLVPILRGEVQPLEIMLKDDLLSRNYEGNVVNAYMSRVLARCVRHLSDVKVDLRVLEVGAGTGSATLPVLQELSRGAEELPTFLSYTFTDISSGFFENARAKFAKWSQRITYKKLDISQDPVQQGFALEDYDLVIASNVLHATPNMSVTLGHVRSLLKPYGKLLLLEGTSHPPLTLPFALLPGWWLAEDEYRSREEGPLLSEEAWQRLLSARGFSGVDSAIASCPGSRENMLVMISSTRIGIREDDHNMGPITICGPLMDNEEEVFAQMVSDHISHRLGCPSSVKPFLEINAADNPFCIFIDSPRHSVLGNISSDSFEALKKTLLDATGVLWVIPENHSPEAEIIKGMLRTLRLENESRNLLLLENVPCSSQGALTIAKLAERLRDPEVAGSMDHDFVWQKGMAHLPRFRQLTAAKEAFASEAGVPIRTVQNIWQGDDSLEMTVDAAGSLDNIYFRRTDVLTQHVGDDEALIRVEAAGVNFRDLLLVLGSIHWATPGLEGSGVVVRTGSHVVDLQPGDRIFYMLPRGGSFATHVRMPSWRACKIPDGISSADAASILVAYSTAVMALMRIARLRKGESVLIHTASGAVGQACIVLAQHLRARIFATAGTPMKREFLHETFGIPKAHIFSSRTPEFKDSIICATEGKGVDVIVNSLGGNLLQETWALIADCGRFVEIGKKDLLQNSYLAMRPFDRNVTFSGVDLRALFDQRPEELRECLTQVVDLLQRKIIAPVRPVTTLPISQIATGLRNLQSGRNVGKIVVTMGPDECVLAECPPPLVRPSGRLLRPDATYLITGGTGGIGLDLASWMIENGARSVVLLGRSGSSRPEVRKLLERHKGTDVRVRAVACDVGSREELTHALQAIQDLPPVRGVVHGALFLRDSLLVNASYDDWQNITRPRVQGAWNLHELLPDADFFIALSSFLGAAGNIGQSIYAGTATFFDAFSVYRNARGLRTVSIALPLVLDIGYVADRDLTETLKHSLRTTLTGAHIRTIVKGAIIGPSSGLNHDGKAISFNFASGDDRTTLPWQSFHPKALVGLIEAEQRSPETNGESKDADTRSTALRIANDGDPLLCLLDALTTKVSSITMIDRDEVEPDAPLSDYSLDSLVSVELRNWIRRETGVRLPLPKIVGAGNLRALAAYILSQNEVSRGTT